MLDNSIGDVKIDVIHCLFIDDSLAFDYIYPHDLDDVFIHRGCHDGVYNSKTYQSWYCRDDLGFDRDTTSHTTENPK